MVEVQTVQTIKALPEDALDASKAYFTDHYQHTLELLAEPDTQSLAIVLPGAPYDHKDWRTALARDLARAHTPKRVNVVAADAAEASREMLVYLRDAPGVTGHYLQAHE